MTADLAKRAVACKGWRWMPGMRAIGRRADALPDLTDPATLGCLLALVREAWNKPDLHIRREADGWRAWTDEPGAFVYHTEAEALVRALEVAP